MTSQVVLERRSLSNADFSGAETTTVRRASEGMRMSGPLNFRRTCAFATFSGAYGGCFQHVFYNVVFLKLFGEGTTRAVISKVVADSVVHAPMISIPLYYMFENMALGHSASEGLRQYSEEWWDACSSYWCMWPFFHCVNFRYTSPELRIAAVAGFSYLWLIVLSFLSHRRLDHGRPDQEVAIVQEQ
jgi:protein Mpv17